MALSQKLSLKTGHYLTLTPQMTQSLRFLGMGNLELQETLKTLIMENPLLSLESPESPLETPVSEAVLSQYSSSVVLRTREHGYSEDGPEALGSIIPQGPPSLIEQLMSQINVCFQDIQDRHIAYCLLNELDEAGYLRASPEMLLQRFPVDPCRFYKILDILKTLDPPGIFSAHLKECFMIQLKDRGTLDASMEKLLDNLELYAQGHLERLQKRCGLSEEALKQKMQELKILNPKPGVSSGFENASAVTVVPDILMKEHPQKRGWLLMLNPQTLPKILLDHGYYSEVLQESSDKAARAYLKEAYKNGTWLQKTLHQRSETILKVATEIVKQQPLFFQRGISALKPCKLSDVGRVLNLHESTISRTIQNKFMTTPLGTIELKSFFTSGISSAYGEKDLSSSAIKERLKILIGKEDKKKPLSDHELVKILEGEGTRIARRTITKYRETLGFPSSFLRKAPW